MNIKLVSLLFITLYLNSCSLFINKIDDDLLNKEPISFKKEQYVQTYCKKNSNFQVINETQKVQLPFLDFLENIKSRYNLNFTDKIILWSLIQMNLRPDLSSPTSKFQFFLKKNGKTYFYHVYSKDDVNATPYFHALNIISKEFHSNYGLVELTQIIDNEYLSPFFVSEFFADFLTQNQEDLKKFNHLKQSYLRGDETLKKNERIKKQKLLPLVKAYLKNLKRSSYVVSNHLFEYKRNNLINSQCNYDLGLYSNSIYLIHDKIIESNTFGLSSQRNVFIADTTQSLPKIESFQNTIFFKGNSQSRSPALCHFNLPLNDSWDLILVSSQSRDPGQHLYHLLEYGLQEMKSVEQIDSLLNFSRHLFLKNPVRLILESERSNNKQLNELLKLNIPVYSSDKLARIWGYYEGNKRNTFINDARRSGSVLCQ